MSSSSNNRGRLTGSGILCLLAASSSTMRTTYELDMFNQNSIRGPERFREKMRTIIKRQELGGDKALQLDHGYIRDR